MHVPRLSTFVLFIGFTRAAFFGLMGGDAVCCSRLSRGMILKAGAAPQARLFSLLAQKN